MKAVHSSKRKNLTIRMTAFNYVMSLRTVLTDEEFINAICNIHNLYVTQDADKGKYDTPIGWVNEDDYMALTLFGSSGISIAKELEVKLIKGEARDYFISEQNDIRLVDIYFNQVLDIDLLTKELVNDNDMSLFTAILNDCDKFLGK